MELLIFDHAGARVLVFPASKGKFFEWEDRQWDDPIRYSTESLSQSLWNKGIWHAKRVWDGWSHDWPW
jgi:esterase/lipase superfamily enzyme